MPWLINASQLDKFRKNQKNVIVLDATWHLPTDAKDAKADFLKHHIVGAKFIDLNDFHDQSSHFPNMLMRDEVAISKKIRELGITNEHKLIFYDHSSLHTSARALWMFKVFGHNPHQLYILDGGYSAWEKYGGKIETDEPKSITPKNYQVTFQAHFIRSLVQMKTNLHHPTEQVVDLRHPVRYAGGKEHRSGLRSGHIPGSFSFPYLSFFEASGNFKPIERLRKQLTGVGIELELPIVTMCGSGMTAPILNFVLDLLNQSDHAVYDGAWCEWGSEQLYPGEADLTERPVERSIDK